ncbi:MAG: DJ-1/PfpI family protein [Myxococcales bacterium]|nr:DJ-1/PfpI family protein [Myxococcales bacterium]
MKTVLVPLPDRDFDVTEVSVPWKLLRQAGHRVVFATEAGATPRCDPLLLTGVIFGQLGADPEPIEYYHELEQDEAFLSPLRWSEAPVAEMDALLLPGGHAPGMRQYLGSSELGRLVADYDKLGRTVASICHGVLVLARAKDPATGKSVLFDRTTTCLPKYMEALAFGLTFWKLGRYYRTYPKYVEDEVRGALRDPAGQFERGPITFGRGTREDDEPAFVVEDGRYLSARWPGDAYLFARTLIDRLAD